MTGAECSVDRSDHRRVHVNGKKGSTFHVTARYGLNQGWKVCKYTFCEVFVPTLPAIDVAVEEEVVEEEVVEDEDGDSKSVEMRDDTQFEEGNADSSDNELEEKSQGKGRTRSPIKSMWMVPLIKNQIAERPNMSNLECKQLLNPYVREVFLTKQILQSARSGAKFELFGDPVENAHYTSALVREATAQGHVVTSISKTSSEVMAMLESMVVKEQAECLSRHLANLF